MGTAVVRNLFSRGDVENQKPNLVLVDNQELSKEELEEFKNVLDRYSKGDDHTRLSLWLCHRELRETFEMLDRIG
jgi:hypothetical protein